MTPSDQCIGFNASDLGFDRDAVDAVYHLGLSNYTFDVNLVDEFGGGDSGHNQPGRV